jgi:hypothetical protein
MQINATTPPGYVRICPSMDYRADRQRIAAELIVARIERNQRLRRLQDQAIQRANSRRFRHAMIRDSVIIVIAAVAIFALIWWCGL